MKNKFAIGVIIASFIALPVFSQPGSGQRGGQGNGQPRQQMSEENVKARINRLAKDLEMNETQKKEILDYELVLFKKNQAERQRLMGNREAMREYMMKQREERDEKYKKVLTEEQWKKYEELREQRRQDVRSRQRNDGDEGERPPRGRRD